MHARCTYVMHFKSSSLLETRFILPIICEMQTIIHCFMLYMYVVRWLHPFRCVSDVLTLEFQYIQSFFFHNIQQNHNKNLYKTQRFDRFKNIELVLIDQCRLYGLHTKFYCCSHFVHSQLHRYVLLHFALISISSSFTRFTPVQDQFYAVVCVLIFNFAHSHDAAEKRRQFDHLIVFIRSI